MSIEENMIEKRNELILTMYREGYTDNQLSTVFNIHPTDLMEIIRKMEEANTLEIWANLEIRHNISIAVSSDINRILRSTYTIAYSECLPHLYTSQILVTENIVKLSSDIQTLLQKEQIDCGVPRLHIIKG